MKSRVGLVIYVLVSVLAILVVMVYMGQVQKAPVSEEKPEGELTYEEHLRTSPPPLKNLKGSFNRDYIILHWDAPVPVTIPHDYSDTLTGYRIYRGTVPGSVSYYATTRNLTFTDRSLSGSQSFVYVVTAVYVGGVESDPADEVIVQIMSSGQNGLTLEEYLKTTPPPPRNLAGTRSGDHISLHWDAPEPVPSPHDYDDTIVGYRIYRGITPETLSLYATTKDRFFTDSAISGSTTFTYEVTALVGGDMESSPSEEITVKTTQ